MKLQIEVVDIVGKTFATDLDTGVKYCKEKWERPWREAREDDFYPMSTQGIFFTQEVYNHRRFGTLREADAFVTTMTLEHLIRSDEVFIFNFEQEYEKKPSENLKQLIDKGKEVLSFHKKELHRYQHQG